RSSGLPQWLSYGGGGWDCNVDVDDCDREDRDTEDVGEQRSDATRLAKEQGKEEEEEGQDDVPVEEEEDQYVRILSPVCSNALRRLQQDLPGNGLVVLVVGYQKKKKVKTKGSGRCRDVVLRRLPLHVGACDLHGEPVQQVLILPFICLDRYLPVVRANDSRATRKLLASRVIYIEVWLPAAILTAPDLVFARVQDIQNVSSSSYLLVEDAVESAGSIALSAHLPAGKWCDVHGDFPLLAHPGGLHPTQTGHPRLQLYHHLQSLLRCHRPGAEEDKSTEEDGNPR
ncbi:hypothetical protein GOODEAATRI_032705, partial [Goodea atripinnis]